MRPSRRTIVLATTVLFLGCSPSEQSPNRTISPRPQSASPKQPVAEVLGDPETGANDWEDAKRKALASPPIEWSCTEIDPFRQKGDFHEWYFSTPFLVPEVYPTVNEWLDSAENTIDTTITNEPTGAQYRISGTKQAGGVQCSVKFIGNVNWK